MNEVFGEANCRAAAAQAAAGRVHYRQNRLAERQKLRKNELSATGPHVRSGASPPGWAMPADHSASSARFRVIPPNTNDLVMPVKAHNPAILRRTESAVSGGRAVVAARLGCQKSGLN
jgi:hypothetical protein